MSRDRAFNLLRHATSGGCGRLLNWVARPLRAARSPELIFRFRDDARGVAEEFHEAVALGFSGTLFEGVRDGFHYTHLFGDGGSNPLVQGDTVLFREALGGLLDGVRKPQWISSSTYGFILFKTSLRRKTETPKRSAAMAKSATLYVTRASASPSLTIGYFNWRDASYRTCVLSTQRSPFGACEVFLSASLW